MVLQHQLIGRRSFGLYEADLDSGELWRAGRKIRLQSQPFRVLAILLEHPGEVISRAELQTLLWGKDAVGDFDQSLGTAVNKIRDALGDTADNPRFVETLARRGYRFIAPVTIIPPVASDPPVVPAPSAEPLIDLPSGSLEATLPLVSVDPPAVSGPVAGESYAKPGIPVLSITPARGEQVRSKIIPLGAFLLGLLVAAIIAAVHQPHASVALLRIEQLSHIGRIAPGMPGMESLPASATDGVRIFVSVLENGRSVLSRVDAHTGAVQPIDLPREVAAPMLGDLSPDLSTLLLRSHLSPESEQPLWTAPVGGGSALRLPNIVAHDATWMPGGKSILYAVGDQLMVDRPDGGGSSLFAILPGRALWLRWSPDGSLLRFTLLDPLRHTMGLWQIDRTGKHLRKMLDGWNQPSSECCGIWADDGKAFVFQATREGHTDLWRFEGDGSSQPVQLTDGPLSFGAPASSGHGGRIYFIGLDTQSLLQRFDRAKARFVPAQAFMDDASRVEYSRDGTRVAWVDQAGRAWRAQADGSERLELTPDSLQVFMAHWSPDGTQLAIMAREPEKAWQLYLVSSDGGSLHHLVTDSRNAADPTWSADGREIAFGRVNDEMGNEGAPRSIEILDVKTGQITMVPDSSNLFSPRWSPDGCYIAALSLDQHQLLLFDIATRHWRVIAQTTAADPVWAANSSALYFHASLAEMQPIYRISIPEGRLEQVGDLSSFTNLPTDYFFSGLDPSDAPIVRSRTATGDLYTLDLEQQPRSAAK